MHQKQDTRHPQVAQGDELQLDTTEVTGSDLDPDTSSSDNKGFPVLAMGQEIKGNLPSGIQVAPQKT